LVLILIIMLLSVGRSCAPTTSSAYLQKAKRVDNLDNADKVYFVNEAYKETIEAGDELYITVTSGNDEPNNFNRNSSGSNQNLDLFSYRVDNNGNIKLPYLNLVNLQGLNLEQAADTLENALSQFIYLPSVSIRFMNSRVAILGEVNSPGLYIFNRKSINIYQAIAQAGDISVYGNRKNVLIVRQVGDTIQKKQIDLTNDEILSSSWYYVRSDDLIYIEPLARKILGLQTFPYSLVFSVFSTTLVTLTFLISILN